jgi:hypothetical protein
MRFADHAGCFSRPKLLATTTRFWAHGRVGDHLGDAQAGEVLELRRVGRGPERHDVEAREVTTRLVERPARRRQGLAQAAAPDGDPAVDVGDQLGEVARACANAEPHGRVRPLDRLRPLPAGREADVGAASATGGRPRRRPVASHIGLQFVGALVLAVTMVTSPALAVGDRASQASDDLAAACGSTWTTVPSADVGMLGDRFSAVDAAAADDAWAVGHSLHLPREGEEFGGSAARADHWDGDRWAATTVPAIDGAIGTALEDVGAVASDDVWAVGHAQFLGVDEFSIVSRPLIVHWDGREWSAVPAPGLGPERSGTLAGIVVLAADDIWAVGSYELDGSRSEIVQPLLMHWEGSAWAAVAGDPAIQQQYLSARLNAVSGTGGEDVWAVGSATRDGVVTDTFVQRWDGENWRMVDSPSPQRAARLSFGSALRDVVARGRRDIVAVGRVGGAPFVIGWNGRRWRSIPTQVRESSGLSGVDALADGRLVVVGSVIDASTLDGRALALDIGRTATTVASEAVAGSFQTSLFDVTTRTVPQWAVGSAVVPNEDGQARERALIQRRCPG